MRSKFLEALDFIKGDRVLKTSWIEPSPGKYPIFKWVKPIKERKENYNIEGVIDCIRFNYCDVIIEKINYLDKNSKIGERIKVQHVWIIKQKNSKIWKTEFCLTFVFIGDVYVIGDVHIGPTQTSPISRYRGFAQEQRNH